MSFSERPETSAIIATLECPWCGAWESAADGRWRTCLGCGCSWRVAGE